MANPEGPRVREIFLAASRRVNDTIESGDRAKFTALFKESTAYFDQFTKEAMALSDMLIDNLVSRA